MPDSYDGHLCIRGLGYALGIEAVAFLVICLLGAVAFNTQTIIRFL